MTWNIAEKNSGGVSVTPEFQLRLCLSNSRISTLENIMKLKLLTSTTALALVSLFATTSLSAADEKEAARPSREEMMKRFDANGDGKLDQAEREAMRAAAPDRQRGPRGESADRPARGERGPGGPGGRGGDRMKQFDTDGDGKLNESERAAAEVAMRAEIQSNPRAMARIDTDKDGKISDAEWAAGRQAMGDQRGQRGPRGAGGEGRGKAKSN